MTESYKLQPGDSVVIYGAGALGRSTYKKIHDIYAVKCFIDKHMKSGDFFDIAVIAPEDSGIYKTYVAIVCVHNANWHMEIAENLHEIGYEKIVFLAIDDMYNQYLSMDMNKIYNFFQEEQYDKLIDIPTYQSLLKREKNTCVIRQSSKWVITWCGKELIYSYNKIDNHQKPYMEDWVYSVLDIPMIAHKPYMSLFRYFMFGQGNADIYLNSMKSFNHHFPMTDKQFILDQYAIYQLLEKSYAKGMEELLLAPISVTWNNRGYFNILDGHHRCAFYWLKGMQKFPLKMTRGDYEKWLNNACYTKAESLLEKGCTLSMQISHPILYSYQSQIVEFEETVLDLLQAWLYDRQLICANILELDLMQGYYSIQLYRMNIGKNIECLVASQQETELLETLFDLYYIPQEYIKLKKCLEECHRQYDLIIMCRMYDTQQLMDNEIALKQLSAKKLFWQSKENGESEKKIIMQYLQFSHYEHLGYKCVNGEASEIGVFSK